MFVVGAAPASRKVQRGYQGLPSHLARYFPRPLLPDANSSNLTHSQPFQRESNLTKNHGFRSK